MSAKIAFHTNTTCIYFDKILDNHENIEKLNKGMIDVIKNDNIDGIPKPSHLVEIFKKYSYEGGFTIPWYGNMRNDFENTLDENGKELLLYHYSCRDFRFIKSDEFIIGLRCKDSIPFWTEDEYTFFNKIFNYIIEKNNLSFNVDFNNFYECDIKYFKKTDDNIQRIIDFVLENNKSGILNGLGNVYAAEGGFSLPYKIGMKYELITNKLDDFEINILTKYHNCNRDFRFGNGVIRCKDNICWWTEEEMIELVRLINLGIDNLTNDIQSTNNNNIFTKVNSKITLSI